MSVLDFLSPALNTASQAAGTYQQAEAGANQLKAQGAIQAIMLARQQRQQEIENALKQAQTGEAGATAAFRLHESQKLQPGDAGYAPMMGQVAGAEASAKWETTKQQLEAEHQNRLSEIQQQGGNSMAVAQEEIRSRQAMQEAQLQFQGTQGDLNRQNAANIAKSGQQAAAQRLGQTQSGEIVPSIMKEVHALGSSNANPYNWFGHSSHPPAPSSTTAPTSSTSPSSLSDADLWEQQRQAGMTPEQATAYVHARHQ